jgi:hypothetical protein
MSVRFATIAESSSASSCAIIPPILCPHEVHTTPLFPSQIVEDVQRITRELFLLTGTTRVLRTHWCRGLRGDVMYIHTYASTTNAILIITLSMLEEEILRSWE